MIVGLDSSGNVYFSLTQAMAIFFRQLCLRLDR